MLTVNGDFGLAASGLAENRRQLIKEDSRFFNQGEINYIVDKLVELEGRLRRTARPDILLELALVQITEPGSDESPAGLTRRLANLEKRLEERDKSEISKTRESRELLKSRESLKAEEEQKADQIEESADVKVSRETAKEDKVEEDKAEKDKNDRDKKIQQPSLEGATAKSADPAADKTEDSGESADYSREEAESAFESSAETVEVEDIEAAAFSEDKTSAREITAKLWEEILDSIKEADIKTHAMIKECRQPVLRSSSLILNFPSDKKFHLQSARKESELIQQKTAEALDIDSELKLEFQLDGSTLQDENRDFQQEPGTSNRANSSTGPKSSGQDARKVGADRSDLIKQAQQIFGGEIISVSAEVLQEQKEILANLKGGNNDEHEENDETGPADAG